MGRKKVDSTIEPKPFKLVDKPGMDEVVKREARKFDVTEERALAIAGEVDVEREAVATITTDRKEGELREVFEQIYDDEVARRKVCPFESCGQRLETIKEAIAHVRMHLLFEADKKTQRGVANDIARQLFPQVEEEWRAVMPADERKRLLVELKRRKVIS